MADSDRSSLELILSQNPDAFLPLVAIYYSQLKSGQIPAGQTYEQWRQKQEEIREQVMPLQSVKLSFDPKALRVQKNTSTDPKLPVWEDQGPSSNKK